MRTHNPILKGGLLWRLPAPAFKALPARGLLVLLILLPLLFLPSCSYWDSSECTEVVISPEEEIRIERVADGLLPVNPVRGRKGWTLEDRMERYNVPGVSIAVIEDFEVAWAKGFGLADVDAKRPVSETTLFQAASVSKPVTAVGALTMTQDGDIDLDDDVESYLVSWSLPRSERDSGAKVTLRRLLSHTAGVTVRGFEGYPYGDDLPTLQQVLAGKGPANNDPIRVDSSPGDFKYSGGGFTILQQAMEDLSGQPFPELMWERVLEPMGMTHSTFYQPLPADRLEQAAKGYKGNGTQVGGGFHVYAAMAAAGLWTTPTDLARFTANLQRSLHGKEYALLARKTAEEMMDPVVEDEVGLGIFLQDAEPEPYFVHSGSNAGFRALLVGHTRDGYGAVLMANADTGSELLQEIVRGIAAEYEWDGLLPEPMDTVELTPEDVAHLAGRFQIGSDGVLIIKVDGSRVIGRVTLGRSFEMFATDRDRFRREDSSTIYEFTDESVVLASSEEKKRTAWRIQDTRRLPSEYIEAGDVGGAVKAYEALREERPEDPAVAERRLNQLGYEAMGSGDLDLAISILEVNTRLYPSSANTYDSLAEAYWNAGDRKSAFRNYRLVLEKLPDDEYQNDRMKEILRGLAEEKLALVEPANPTR